MKTDKSKKNESQEKLTLPPGVSWEEVIEALRGEKGQQFLKTISPDTFKFILKESNHSQIVKSLLNTLKETDPQNANEEYAEMNLKAMQKVIRTLVKQKKPPVDSKK